LSLVLKFTLEYAIRKTQCNSQERLYANEAHDFWVRWWCCIVTKANGCVAKNGTNDPTILFVSQTLTDKKFTENPLDCSWEVVQKQTQRKLPNYRPASASRHQNVRQNHDAKIANRSFRKSSRVQM
jgi:hypothetical protein